jgi:AbrB family looped-hinge helix DNA binding protein
MADHTRKVGDRGQVTIPKELRDRRGIDGGDEIRFIEADGEIIIKPPTDTERLAEGYERRADRSRQLVEEMDGTSAEATERLGTAPEREE